VLRATVEEAHEHGLPVAAHWGSDEDLEDVVAAGVDELEHLEPRRARVGQTEQRLPVPPEVLLTPTLAVLQAATRRPESPLPASALRESQARLGEFYRSGGRVVVGSDAGMPGVLAGDGVHRELALLVESGLTPREALRAATSEAARVLRDDGLGAIAPGRLADLVVVEGDPLQNIDAARQVLLVFREGRVVVDRR
jgi:enamidase